MMKFLLLSCIDQTVGGGRPQDGRVMVQIADNSVALGSHIPSLFRR